MKKLMSSPILVARHLQKRIGAKEVLSDVSLELGDGGALAILGANGAGKTTLLKVLAGLWTPSGGELIRFGIALGNEARSDPRIGFLGHRSFLYPHLSARENLRFYGRLWGLSHVNMQVDRVLRLVGLAWSQNDPIHSYSRGMLQRAAIARVLLTDPQLVLMDEPYTGLDLRAQVLLEEILRRYLAEGGALVWITHQVKEALPISQAMAILDGGRLVWWAPTASANPSEISSVYQRWLSDGGIRYS